ncbi:MAG: [FeFe] hydrogenase H-cluster maturation GTPase HydF [Ruminococcus sp.]
MGLNDTPLAERVHIGFFGRRNAGKSSLVNAVTGQKLSVVSEVLGTTTDPVMKAMELLPLGPVVIIDTPGIDDEGSLGEMRVEKARQVLNRTDIAVLVLDGAVGKTAVDNELIGLFKEKNIPYIVAYNKADLLDALPQIEDGMFVSAEQNTGIYELKEKIASLVKPDREPKRLCSDLIGEGDIVVLVVPIDKAAPKGRIILPQQMAIRDILDVGAVAVTVRDTELEQTLKSLGKKPALVITDSQAFASVAKIVPEDIRLTSFSILMARYKGVLDTATNGARAIDTLSDGDTVLISEGCTHHRQCDDIGTVKLPRLLKSYTGKSINIETSSGREFPTDLTKYKLVIHCGGCMLNEKEVDHRRQTAEYANVPFTNYGIAISYMRGIFDGGLFVNRIQK